MTRRTGGVLKKFQRVKHQKRMPFTYYGREDRCAICDVSMDELPIEATGDWTFHWNGIWGTQIVAETCSKPHAEEFEVYHRPEIDDEWNTIVEIRKGMRPIQRS